MATKAVPSVREPPSIFEPATPIGRLIRRRQNELGLRTGHLVARLGYQNLGRGANHIQLLCSTLWSDAVTGFHRACKDRLLANLPAALDLSEHEVKAAIDETRQQIEAERRRKYRPVASISTTAPPIRGWMDSMTRGRWLWVYFDQTLPVEAIHRQIQGEIWRRKEANLVDPTGYRIYWFDRIERYDLAGKLLDVREAYEGVATAASR